MTENHDVIVVGGGLTGLMTGALLANAGKRILLLEEKNNVGGRASSTEYKGHILDNGIHAPGSSGWPEKVFARIGKPYPELIPFNNSEIYDYDTGWLPIMYSHPEVRRIIEQDILANSYEELEKYDDVSLEEWVSKRTKDEGTKNFFWLLGMSFLVGNKFGPISTGELLIELKELIDKWGNLRQISGVLAGGYSKLIDPLVETIKDKGGEIRTGARVLNIIVRDGCAKGVEVDSKTKLYSNQVLDGEIIEAPLVICTLPVWDIFSVISEDIFPAWYVDWIHNIEHKVCYVGGIVAGLDRPLWNEQTTRWVPKMRKSQIVGYFLPMPGYGKSVNEYQAQFYFQGNWDEVPNLFEISNCRTRVQMDKLIDDFESDLKEVLPEFEKNCKWKQKYVGFFDISMAPSTVGRHRIPMELPGISNLYWASPTVREARGTGGGTQMCGKAAVCCADRVLSKGQS